MPFFMAENDFNIDRLEAFYPRYCKAVSPVVTQLLGLITKTNIHKAFASQSLTRKQMPM